MTVNGMICEVVRSRVGDRQPGLWILRKMYEATLSFNSKSREMRKSSVMDALCECDAHHLYVILVICPLSKNSGPSICRLQAIHSWCNPHTLFTANA